MRKLLKGTSNVQRGFTSFGSDGLRSSKLRSQVVCFVFPYSGMERISDTYEGATMVARARVCPAIRTRSTNTKLMAGLDLNRT